MLDKRDQVRLLHGFRLGMLKGDPHRRYAPLFRSPLRAVVAASELPDPPASPASAGSGPLLLPLSDASDTDADTDPATTISVSSSSSGEGKRGEARADNGAAAAADDDDSDASSSSSSWVTDDDRSEGGEETTRETEDGEEDAGLARLGGLALAGEAAVETKVEEEDAGEK